MAEEAHSPLGGSTLKRWSHCPGSIRLSRGIPNRSSKYAEEGTLAHEVAATYLRTLRWPKADPEMLEAVKVYTDVIAAEMKALAKPRIWIEQKFSLAQIHPNLFGTADCVIYDHNSRLLKVVDYKHGSGTVVEVQEAGKPNEQLMYYALGASLSLNLAVDALEIVIVQPRCPHADGPVRRFRMDGLCLLDFAADLAEFAQKTEDPNAPLRAGSHCKFCPASGICSEIHKNALTVAKAEFSPAFSYDPAKLSEVLHWLPVVEAWAKSVREFAYGEAQHGRVPPGWKLVAKRATRKWQNEIETPRRLQLRGLDDKDIFERSVRSPAQIEKTLKELGLGKELLDGLIVQESSGYTLAPEADRRPGAKLDAKSEFDVVTV